MDIEHIYFAEPFFPNRRVIKIMMDVIYENKNTIT